MITIEEAKAIAGNRLKDISECEEVRTIRYVDYVEPTSYFTPEMLKVAEEWEKKKSIEDLNEEDEE